MKVKELIKLLTDLPEEQQELLFSTYNENDESYTFFDEIKVEEHGHNILNEYGDVKWRYCKGWSPEEEEDHPNTICLIGV